MGEHQSVPKPWQLEVPKLMQYSQQAQPTANGNIKKRVKPNLATFMISSKNGNSLRITNFQGHQELKKWTL